MNLNLKINLFGNTRKDEFENFNVTLGHRIRKYEGKKDRRPEESEENRRSSMLVKCEF